MNTSSKGDRATRRSSRSLVRLYGGVMTATEEQQFNEWRGQDDDFNDAFRDTTRTLARMQDLEDDPDIMAMLDQPAERSAIVQLDKFWRPIAVAASLIMAVSVAWVTLQGMDEESAGHNMLRYVTRVGEQKQVELTDGSLINLNTGTQLLVDMSDHQRRVILERGEAFFDVASDPTRPFSVELGNKAVSVLGTEFNILKSPEGYQLAVVEGMVSLHDRDEPSSESATLLSLKMREPAPLDPAKQYRITAGTVIEHDIESDEMFIVEPQLIASYGEWRTGFIRFNDVPLSEVIRQFNRYSGKKILIEDSSVLDLRILASVKVDEISMALSGLEDAYPIKVVRHFDRIVIKGRK